MPSREIRIEDLPGALREEMARLAPEAVRQAMFVAAMRGEALAVTRSQEFANTGEFALGWQVDEDEEGVELRNVAPHAAIVEEGSRPHWPPFVPILEYIAAKTGKGGLLAGLSLNAADRQWGYAWEKNPHWRQVPGAEALRRMAYGLCVKIAAQGTPPGRIMASLQDDLVAFLEHEIVRLLAE